MARDFNRLDVYRALDEVDDPNVGFRHDLDFSRWAPGSYALQVVARTPQAAYELGQAAAGRRHEPKGAGAPSDSPDACRQAGKVAEAGNTAGRESVAGPAQGHAAGDVQSARTRVEQLPVLAGERLHRAGFTRWPARPACRATSCIRTRSSRAVNSTLECAVLRQRRQHRAANCRGSRDSIPMAARRAAHGPLATCAKRTSTTMACPNSTRSSGNARRGA